MRRLGASIGFVAGSLLRIRRREVVDRLLLAGVDDAERVADAMYRSLGIGLVELLAAGATRGAIDRVFLTPRAEEALRLAERGGVAATAHLGNWDLVACAVAERARLAVVTKRLSIGLFDRIWQGIRARRGVRLLDASGSIPAALAAMREGFLVGAIVDQAPRDRRAAMLHPFLGRPAWHDLSAATLAARSKKPLLVAVGRRRDDGRHEVDVPLVLEPPSRPTRAWIEEATRRTSDEVARFVRAHPDQWLWLHRRWKDVAPRVTAAAWKTSSASGPTRSVRASSSARASTRT